MRHLFRCTFLGALLGVLCLAGIFAAQAQASDAVALGAIKASLGEIEAALGRDDITAEELAGLREKVNTASDALRAAMDELEPRAHDAEERLKQLGPAPGKDASPETPEIAKEREELAASFSAIDGALKEAR